ncbi:MAG: 23S rRNA pseudouridine(2605) synthase RluB [Gammaproteobacteria bacterium]
MNHNKPKQHRRPTKPTTASHRNKPNQSTNKESFANARRDEEQHGERIQKVLARGGVGSRREIERWILEGRLRLNGVQAKLGDHLQPGDHLQLNGRVIHWDKFTRQTTRVLIYHKPVGEVVTRHDPEGRPVVFTQLPKLKNGRWITVGRLDINTSGLLIVTNNGELANRMMHPSTELDREYAVRILGDVDESVLATLKQGVELEDGPARFDDIRLHGGEGANKWFHVVVGEGRNRLVRRLWESQGVTVSRLMRVRYGMLTLPEGLKAHSFYELQPKELDALLISVGLPKEKTFSPTERKSVDYRRPNRSDRHGR